MSALPAGHAAAVSDRAVDAVAAGGQEVADVSGADAGRAADSLAARVARLEAELAEVRERLAALEPVAGDAE
jgi:uncharacterized protein YceH (UPF0502 family)